MYRIGSTSKMFVALAVLKLVEEGRLSLDDRLADLAPDVEFENPWEDTAPVRLVHLLEHTTGWDDIHLPEYAHNDPTPATLKQGLDFHPHSRISRWQPGTRMSYCNAGPSVAAYIVEKITGRDFEDYVAEHFFGPMGMESMTYRLSDEFRARGATLYTDGEPEDYWHISMRPTGSINASPSDMAKMVQFFVDRGMAGGRQLVSRASLERMESPASSSAARAGQAAGYGLSNYSSPFEQWMYREHNGGVNGGLTEFAYLPEAGLGHAIMITSGNGAALGDISDLVRGFETRQLAAKSVAKELDVTAAHRAIEGYYYPINPRQQVGYFIERVLNVQKLRFEGHRLARKAMLDDEVRYYYPVSEALYKHEKTGVTSLTATTDPLAGPVVHVGMGVYKPASPLLIFGQWGVGIAWVFFIATSLLFFPVWLVRRIRRRIPAGGPTRVRVWPLLASIVTLCLVGLFMAGMRDPFISLGAPTAISMGIWAATFLFAICAVLGVYCSFSERRTAMNRVAWWHSTLASWTHLVVMVYLASFGIIGLVTWA